MAKPVVGVIGNAHKIDDRFWAQICGENNFRAVAEAAEALPLAFAGHPDVTEVGALLDVVDGVLLTGARANVHPERYGAAPGQAYEPYDTGRDAVSLPLIEACVARGVPIFGVCRGFQEMNVAFGGTLHPEIREIPGRMNHRMPRLEDGTIHPDQEVIFAPRHLVRLARGGVFEALLGAPEILVNTLHGQGVLEPGPRVVIEGIAEDGTAEALRIDGAPGFALGVQWHAEYKAAETPVHRALFGAFGAALKAYRQARAAS